VEPPRYDAAMRRAVPTVLGLVAVVVLLAPRAALAQADAPREADPQVVLVGDVGVAAGRVVGEVVVFRGDVTVDGVVDGDVIVVRGAITVAGQVRGDVVSASGRVRLRPTAQVGGSVLAGDTVDVEPGATVAGGVTQGVRFSLGTTVGAIGALLAPAAFAASTLLLLAMLLLLVPRGLERVGEAGRTAPFAAAGWGVLGAIAVAVAGVVLTASVLGLPLGVALLLAWWAFAMVGIAATAWIVGRLVIRSPRSRVGALFAGWGIASVVGLVPFVNVAWWILAAVYGWGAVVVATWRARRAAAPPDDPTGKGGRHRAGRTTPPGSLPADGEDVPAARFG